MAICVNPSCAKEFEGRWGAKACSPACRAAYKKIYSRERPDSQSKVTEQPCPICGAVFLPRCGSKTCSPECRKEANRRHARNRHKRMGPQERVCANCGAVFLTEIAAQRFCQKSCMREFHNHKKEKTELSPGSWGLSFDPFAGGLTDWRGRKPDAVVGF